MILKCKICGDDFKVSPSRSHAKYCSYKCSGLATKKRINGVSPNWKGGKTTHTNGYILIVSRDHPNRMMNRYMLEHRLVCEKFMGRYLYKTEVVHHVNGDKTDNRIENLMVFKSDSAHNKFERNFNYDESDLVFDGRNYENDFCCTAHT